jgi:sulfatase maturation enzyme AslB (radical SAM superfamily)
MERVVKTKLGHFIRINEGFGAIVFSPFSGLFFAIKEEFVVSTLNYCNSISNDLPAGISKHLEIGRDNIYNKNFEIKHYLPDDESFSISNELPENPIVINWLISNRCNCNCSYCYAGDVIDHDFVFSDINETADNILNLNPIAVVISGGEPMLEKQKMIDALNALGNKVGIIVDTNGLIWDNDLTTLFIKYNVVVRISLDSLNDDNYKIRPNRDKSQNKFSLMKTINNIYDYRKNNIPVLIHSVITSVNKNALNDLFVKLPTMGVNGWRIFSVIKPNDVDKQKSFSDIMNFGGSSPLSDQQTDIKNKINFFINNHISKSNFSIQVIPAGENTKNSVVLVLPDGEFYTESKFSDCKTKINPNSIFRSVDLWSHYERYLGKVIK